MKRIETREIKGSAGPGSIEEAWRDQSLWTHLSVEEAVIHDCTLRRHQSRLLIWSMMLLLSTVISLACVLGVESLPTWIDSRWSTVKECITDLKVVSCDDFDCGLEGYHRIDSFLNLSENTTVWNYVFYKSELDQDPGNCITDLRVVPEGEDCPTAPYWKSCGVSAHHGVTSTGGPTIWAQYEPGAQYAGEVVDLVVLRPGQYPDKTEDFIRQPVNLGLGSRAASASYPQWVEYESISSGWVWLEYTKAGVRPPITGVKIVACPEDSTAAECGRDLIAQGWNRRDLDLNGPTVNGSHIFLFTSTGASEDGSCVTGLQLVDAIEDDSDGVNVNDGTDGATRYLGVTRGKNTCLTSVVPVASSQVFPRPYYQIVQDAHGNPADFNEGATNAVPIYVYTSSETELNPPSAPTLSFNSTGSFRIAHFSDLHHSDIAPICLDEPFEFRANCTEQFSFTFMERALDLTRPDLVIINGDLFARNKRQKDDITYPLLTQGALLKAVYPILNRSLPFAVTWGNHDAEGSLLREELQREMSRLPGYVGSNVASLDGQGNYQLDILDRDGDSKMKLWFFDSRSYTYFPLNGSTTGQSGGVHRNQVEWFERESRGLEMNGMAFFHIPLGQMSGSLGLNSSAELGVHSEDVCSQGHECSNTPDLADNDTGFFDAIVNGNHIKATFSGHDHSNDFSTSVKGVTFTYDGSAGYTAYSTGNDPNYNREMRVIDIVSWGESATTYKVIDDILKGTVHRNTSEPILTLY